MAQGEVPPMDPTGGSLCVEWLPSLSATFSPVLVNIVETLGVVEKSCSVVLFFISRIMHNPTKNKMPQCWSAWGERLWRRRKG